MFKTNFRGYNTIWGGSAPECCRGYGLRCAISSSNDIA